ncbi:MAG: holo-ACP synthase [Alphaproteobacteria bacterium]|nr:holo-ACP synthase [Alphaproteobacteria bacterium]
MILGIGNDVVDIRRIERAVARFGDRFLARIFTETERRKTLARPNTAAGFALRYAAKEACAKALGTGFRNGVFWRDLRVDNLPSGQPVMTLSGGAEARLVRLTPVGMRAVIHVTMSDEPPMAHAVVVIDAVPLAPAAGGGA